MGFACAYLLPLTDGDCYPFEYFLPCPHWVFRATRYPGLPYGAALARVPASSTIHSIQIAGSCRRVFLMRVMPAIPDIVTAL
jgi:hypothetical protein